MAAKQTRIRHLSHERLPRRVREIVLFHHRLADDSGCPAGLDDSIARTVRPTRLPPEIYDYLSPRKRICCFIDGAGRMS
jgi:hypothetical protein